MEIKNEKSSFNSTQDDGSVSMAAEFSLQSLIIDAFNGHGFEKIKEYLKRKENTLNQKYNQLLLIYLDRLINKELDKNEFQYVSLLLKCIQRFFMDDTKEDEQLLIQKGLIPKVISKCSRKGKIQLLDSFLYNLGLLVADKTINYLIRQEGLSTLNSILEKIPQEEREKFPFSEDKCFLMEDLAKAILDIGDYDFQVALSEVLCRMMNKKSRAHLAHRWFEDDFVAVAFKEIRDREFETDSRRFLNCLNDRLGEKRRVYTFPCIAAFVDGCEVRKPRDENLEKFWIDFNTGSQSITFYIESTEGDLWESVRILKEAVGSFTIKEVGKKVFVVYLKQPLLFNNKEAMRIEIHFDLQSNILNACIRVLGLDKYLLNSDQTENEEPPENTKSFEEQDTVEIFCSPEKKVVQEPIYQEESVNEDKVIFLNESSQLVKQAETTKRDSNSTSVDFLDLEDSNQEEVASKQNSLDGLKEKDKIQDPILYVKPSSSLVSSADHVVQGDSLEVDGLEKGRKRTSSSKNIPETKENPYDFTNSSDAIFYQTVVEAKQRILSHPDSSEKKRGSSTFSSYKKHRKRKLLSLESNSETSSGMSGSSWMSNQKEKKFKTYFKQKRPKVRSNMRVLPLSSSSSGSDDQKDKAIPLWKRISKQNKSPDLPVLKFQDTTVSLKPEESAKKPFQSVPPLSTLSSSEYSDVTEDLSKSTAPKSLMERTILEQDPQNVETSALQVIPDNLGESAIISAFENFTKDLKKDFSESRYQNIDICSRNAMEASEKLSMLLDQIHQCRLDKLEQFHKNIVPKLDNFKKNIQVLKDLEKEILDFVKEQSTKLNSFCKLQMQSLNHLRKDE